jgi:hypothetical protein
MFNSRQRLTRLALTHSVIKYYLVSLKIAPRFRFPLSEFLTRSYDDMNALLENRLTRLAYMVQKTYS